MPTNEYRVLAGINLKQLLIKFYNYSNHFEITVIRRFQSGSAVSNIYALVTRTTQAAVHYYSFHSLELK